MLASSRSKLIFGGLLGAAVVSFGLYFQTSSGVAPTAPTASPSRPKPVEEVLFSDGTVRVSAVVDGDDYWIAELIVRGHEGEFRIETVGFGVESQLRQTFVDGIRAGIGWKDDLLVVPVSCGGGNAWRCDRVRLFREFEGRLVEFGEVDAGPYDAPLGSMIHDGVVVDLFDKLEANPFTSHAGAPSFEIVLRVEGARLVVDRDATWKHVEAEYRAGSREIEGCLKDEPEHTNCGYSSKSGAPLDPNDTYDLEGFQGRILLTAALARYCGRDTELERTMSAIKRLVDDPTYRMIESTVQGITPGEFMRWGS